MPGRYYPPALKFTVEPWKLDAACTDAPLAWFFSEQEKIVAKARALCRACPVRQECLDYATRTPEPFGTWGGLTEHERRQPKRGRRKTAA